MAYSFSTSVGDAVTTVFAFTFTGLDKGYLNKSDVHVELVDEQGIWTEVQYNTGWIFETTNSIRFLQTPPPVNTKFPHNIRIRRIMDKSSPYADWSVGQNFDEQTLDNSFLKLLYIEHELLDGFGMRDATGNINMHGYRITDMAKGINENDAVTLKQVTEIFSVVNSQGVIPIEGNRQTIVAGVTQYDTPATKFAIPYSFLVFVDTLRQKPVTDYTTNTIGKIDLIGDYPVGADLDIIYFEPVTIQDLHDASKLDFSNVGTTQPAAAGVLWVNNGILTISQ